MPADLFQSRSGSNLILQTVTSALTSSRTLWTSRTSHSSAPVRLCRGRTGHSQLSGGSGSDAGVGTSVSGQDRPLSAQWRLGVPCWGMGCYRCTARSETSAVFCSGDSETFGERSIYKFGRMAIISEVKLRCYVC